MILARIFHDWLTVTLEQGSDGTEIQYFGHKRQGDIFRLRKQQTVHFRQTEQNVYLMVSRKKSGLNIQTARKKENGRILARIAPISTKI